MSQVFVIHENSAWIEPLRREFAILGTPVGEMFLDQGLLDLTSAPPPGVFYNRMSASSHTRGHTYAPEYAAAVIEWLERHGRTVVNGRRALQLEVSKVAQYQALAAFNIPAPPTIAVVGTGNIQVAAEKLGFPVILKHNRAGKGLGVRLVLSAPALAEAMTQIIASNDEHSQPRDGIWLVQRYIHAPQPFITRAEFVGGKFLYAVRVDTSEGFELCPADVCQLESVCPASAAAPKFQVIPGFAHPLIPRWEAFLQANGIGVGAIEFATDAEGNAWSYDVNTNTNYNPEAEAKAGVSGMGAIARHLTALLRRSSFQASAEYAFAA